MILRDDLTTALELSQVPEISLLADEIADVVLAAIERRNAPLKPGETWEYVGCRTCGEVITVSAYRIQAEGMPWCTHSNAVTYGSPVMVAGLYTRMVYVDVAVR